MKVRVTLEVEELRELIRAGFGWPISRQLTDRLLDELVAAEARKRLVHADESKSELLGHRVEA